MHMIGGDGDRKRIKNERKWSRWAKSNVADCPDTPVRPHIFPTYGMDMRFTDNPDMRG